MASGRLVNKDLTKEEEELLQKEWTDLNCSQDTTSTDPRDGNNIPKPISVQVKNDNEKEQEQSKEQQNQEPRKNPVSGNTGPSKSFKDWKQIKDAEEFVTNLPAKPKNVQYQRMRPQESFCMQPSMPVMHPLARPQQFPLWELIQRQCTMQQVNVFRNQMQLQLRNQNRGIPMGYLYQQQQQQQWERHQFLLMQQQQQQQKLKQNQNQSLWRIQMQQQNQARSQQKQLKSGSTANQNQNQNQKKQLVKNSQQIPGKVTRQVVKPLKNVKKAAGDKQKIQQHNKNKEKSSNWIQKPPLPPQMDDSTPETRAEKQRMWREYRQAMKPFKHRDFANAKRTIQRLSKKPESELDEKERVRFQKAQEQCASHKAALSQRSATRWVQAQNNAAQASTVSGDGGPTKSPNSAHTKKTPQNVASSWKMYKNATANNNSNSKPQAGQGVFPVKNFVSGGFLANNAAQKQ